MTQIIDGVAFAQKLREKIKQEVTTIKDKHNQTLGLAVILVGDDPASGVYVRSKSRQTKEVGMTSYQDVLPADTPQQQLLDKIAALNNDPQVDGILVQLPLPAHIDESTVLAAIDPQKDVDGFHAVNVGALWNGTPSLVPCTPLACSLLLKDYLGDLSGKNALIVGRSNIVGKPCAGLLLKEHCTITIAHSRTQNLKEQCQKADILIAAVGKPRFVQGDWVKKGATVIDVGINRITENDKTKLVGDVDFDTAKEAAQFITPVPGGVGPMTIACLLLNTLAAAKARRNLS
ncbi:MAG: bifunctional methylenetetrahydrofolate dehydrogenase/methenyltetrahydrofolate cyclohydrolase FolD [Alphaproteobacteria bacterium GM202ARS2]|nr:bifunctional methylenetetrahydrofolate dehydrogenase/methenyltetrahydrofolate cyclohydrolase FolD [Alphaproteobacteria bacterium GM202ARS2]